jgi:hypothetical protein
MCPTMSLVDSGNLEFRATGISFIYYINKLGIKIDPCGTPNAMETYVEYTYYNSLFPPLIN